jgi:hypothetical protein
MRNDLEIDFFSISRLLLHCTCSLGPQLRTERSAWRVVSNEINENRFFGAAHVREVRIKMHAFKATNSTTSCT